MIKSTSTLTYILIISLILINCSTTGKKKKIYLYENSKSGNKFNTEKSDRPIDRGAAFEIYFTLEKPVDCIKIGISSDYISDTFTHEKKYIKTYFIVEQLIDLSKFPGAKSRFTFTEIGKNFNDTWSRKREITICIDPQNPLLKLDNNTIYRIRFTVFRYKNFNYKISIYADCRIKYLKKSDIF